MAQNSEQAITKVCCIGAGYVGATTSAVMAYKNPSVEVIVVDTRESQIRAWNSDSLPIYEPGLGTILSIVTSSTSNYDTTHGQEKAQEDFATQRGNLIFSTNIEHAIQNAQLIFVCVDTPTKTTGSGAGFATDLRSMKASVERIVDLSTTDKIIVEKSTVPCGTAACLRELVARGNDKGVKLEILSNPEFLAEGSAIHDLLHPDRVIIGCEDTVAGRQAMAKLSSLYKTWIAEDRIIVMNLWSSEFAKLAANALLAQRISSINSLSAICEAIGADIHGVSRACGLDSRIGPSMLRPSIGFGGSCFEKDLRSLVYIAGALGLTSVASYWLSVVNLNEYQKCRQSRRIVDFLYPKTCNRVAILGFAFKRGTGNSRETPALAFVRDFAYKGFQINIYDPQAKVGDIQEIIARAIPASQLQGRISIFMSALEACEQVHAIVIATAWDQFRTNSDLHIR